MSMRDDIVQVLSQVGPNKAPIDTPDVRELLAFSDGKNVRLVWLTDQDGRYAVAAIWQEPGSAKYTSFAPMENPADMTHALQQFFSEH